MSLAKSARNLLRGPIRWHLAFGQIEKKPQRLVHRLGILERLCNIGVEEHDVGIGFVLLVVLSPDAGRKIVLGSEVVVVYRGVNGIGSHSYVFRSLGSASLALMRRRHPSHLGYDTTGKRQPTNTKSPPY